MAGSGDTTTYVDSKTYHQTMLNDYSNNVIVPKSLLIDTADAIRLKKDGTKELNVDNFNGDVINGIEPVDFATKIGNLQTMEFSTHKTTSFGPSTIYRNGSAKSSQRSIVGYTVKNTSNYTATVEDFLAWWNSVIIFGLNYCVPNGNNLDQYIALFSKEHFYYCKKHNLPWFEAGWVIYNPNNNFKLNYTTINEIASGNIYRNVNGSPSNPFIGMSNLLNPQTAEYLWSNSISTSATAPATHFHLYRKTSGTSGATTATSTQKNPSNWQETLQSNDSSGVGNFYLHN